MAVKNDDLVLGTHGRSIWILDDLAAIREMSPEVKSKAIHLFAAPLTTDPNKASWSFLALAGLIGGGPTFLGTWIGYLASSTYFSIAFLAVAAGALLYVLNELFHLGRRVSTPTTFAWGLLMGFLVAYATDLFLTIVSGA